MNSGNANCANGERGMRDAARMAELTAQKFGVDPNLVYVSSTGIIGRPLPMEKVERGIAQMEVRPDGGHEFARGIMTTDTRPKTIAVEFEVGGKTVRLGGSTKGAGMIYPNMATMLCYLTSDDAACAPEFLQAAATRRGRRLVQHGLHGRRHVHQRHRAALRQRHGWQRAADGGRVRAPTHSARRCGTSRATSRARWHATARARRS